MPECIRGDGQGIELSNISVIARCKPFGYVQINKSSFLVTKCNKSVLCGLQRPKIEDGKGQILRQGESAEEKVPNAK